MPASGQNARSIGGLWQALGRAALVIGAVFAAPLAARGLATAHRGDCVVLLGLVIAYY